MSSERISVQSLPPLLARTHIVAVGVLPVGIYLRFHDAKKSSLYNLGYTDLIIPVAQSEEVAPYQREYVQLDEVVVTTDQGTLSATALELEGFFERPDVLNLLRGWVNSAQWEAGLVSCVPDEGHEACDPGTHCSREATLRLNMGSVTVEVRFKQSISIDTVGHTHEFVQNIWVEWGQGIVLPVGDPDYRRGLEYRAKAIRLEEIIRSGATQEEVEKWFEDALKKLGPKLEHNGRARKLLEAQLAKVTPNASGSGKTVSGVKTWPL